MRARGCVASRPLRIAIAVGLTAIVLWNAHPATCSGRAAPRPTPGWIGAAVLLVFLDRTLMAWRWIDLLCALTPGSRPPFPDVLRIFFVSTFVGNFVPSVGGDVSRLRLSRYDVRLAESAASVLMDRVLGVLSIAIRRRASRRSLRANWLSSAAIVVPLALALLLCAGVAAAVSATRRRRWRTRSSLRLPRHAARQAGAALTDAVRRYAGITSSCCACSSRPSACRPSAWCRRGASAGRSASSCRSRPISC